MQDLFATFRPVGPEPEIKVASSKERGRLRHLPDRAAACPTTGDSHQKKSSAPRADWRIQARSGAGHPDRVGACGRCELGLYRISKRCRWHVDQALGNADDLHRRKFRYLSHRSSGGVADFRWLPLSIPVRMRRHGLTLPLEAVRRNISSMGLSQREISTVPRAFSTSTDWSNH